MKEKGKKKTFIIPEAPYERLDSFAGVACEFKRLVLLSRSAPHHFLGWTGGHVITVGVSPRGVCHVVWFVMSCVCVLWLCFTGAPRKEVYFMAVIDILQHYDAKKKAAHAAKTVKHGVRDLCGFPRRLCSGLFVVV